MYPWDTSGGGFLFADPLPQGTGQAMTIERAQFVFHNIIRAQCAIWVGILDEHIVAYLAMKESYLDRLYVDPSE